MKKIRARVVAGEWRDRFATEAAVPVLRGDGVEVEAPCESTAAKHRVKNAAKIAQEWAVQTAKGLGWTAWMPHLYLTETEYLGRGRYAVGAVVFEAGFTGPGNAPRYCWIKVKF